MLRPERRHVDREAVLHTALRHLPRLGEAADEREASVYGELIEIGVSVMRRWPRNRLWICT